jgi:hypothetical protein
LGSIPLEGAVTEPKAQLIQGNGRMKRLLTSMAILLTLAGAIVACSNTEENISCTAVELPGLRLNVRNALSGEPAAEGATGFILDGDYSETIKTIKNPADYPQLWASMEAAYERPGTYTVVVQKPGYQEWRRENVQVDAGVCHVSTVKLEVRLEPAQ